MSAIINSRLVIAQVLAGVTLALGLTSIIAGVHVVREAVDSALGTTAIIAGLISTTVLLVLSAAAFVLSLKRRSFLVAGLLAASGVIFLMFPMTVMGEFSQEPSAAPIHIYSYGLVILGLGVAKGITSFRTAVAAAR